MLSEDPRKNWTSEKLVNQAIGLEMAWLEIDNIDSDIRTDNQNEQWLSLSDEYWDIVHELRTRGSDVELEICKQLVADGNVAKRILGADILGSLGYQEKSKYYDYAMQTLIKLLDDEHEQVISSAGYSLGHRANSDDFSAIPKLIALANHSHFEVRNGILHGLMAKEEANAIQTIIKLCDDEHPYIRDWAIFAIGSQIEADTPEIREVLHRKLDSNDFNERGEALVGLAERGDRSILPKLKKELEGGFEGSYALSACESLAEPSLISYLERIKKDEIHSMESYHIDCLDDAILVCKKNIK